MSHVADQSILLVGTISNVEKIVERELYNVISSLSRFKSIDIFLVESDSLDKTHEVLKKLKASIPFLNFVNLGVLKPTIPDRIERIRYSRNIYVNYICDNYETSKWNFVVVADLDGMNSKLKSKAIDSCFGTNLKWDACMANQKHGYYDLYALREAEWMPKDCFEELAELKLTVERKPNKSKGLFGFIRAFLFYDKLREKAIYSKMRVIKVGSHWIKVQSAFGGLGIYRTNLFLTSNYDRIEPYGNQRSEHIDFHSKCVANGASLYINPNLINANWNIYNLNKFKLVRFAREFLKYLRGL